MHRSPPESGSLGIKIKDHAETHGSVEQFGDGRSQQQQRDGGTNALPARRPRCDGPLRVRGWSGGFVDKSLFVLRMRQRHPIKAMSQQKNDNEIQKVRTDPQDQPEHSAGGDWPLRIATAGIVTDWLQFMVFKRGRKPWRTQPSRLYTPMRWEKWPATIKSRENLLQSSTAGFAARIAVGAANGDRLRIRAKLPDDRRSGRARIAGVQHQDFLITANVDCAQHPVQ